MPRIKHWGLLIGAGCLLFCGVLMAARVSLPTAVKPESIQTAEPVILAEIDEQQLEDMQISISDEPSVTFLGSIHIGRDEVRNEDVVVIGGSGTIEGKVNGSFVVIGGNGHLSGSVTGDVVVIGGSVLLADSSEIGGKIVTMGGTVNRSPNAVVTIGKGISDINPLQKIRSLISGFHVVAITFWLVMSLFVILLLSRNIENAAAVMRSDSIKCLLSGFIFHSSVSVLALILVSTIIGIPLCFILFLFWVFIGLFGVPVGFVVLGQLILEAVKQTSKRVFLAGLIGFFILAVSRFVPFGIGFTLWHLWAMAGIGAAILTKFGTMRPWFRKKPGYTHPEQTQISVSVSVDDSKSQGQMNSQSSMDVNLPSSIN